MTQFRRTSHDGLLIKLVDLVLTGIAGSDTYIAWVLRGVAASFTRCRAISIDLYSD